jgi:hypothetical protein
MKSLQAEMPHSLIKTKIYVDKPKSKCQRVNNG